MSECLDGEVLFGDTRNEDRLGLSEARVLLGDQEVLSENDESGRFTFDEIEYVDCKEFKSVVLRSGGEGRGEDLQVRIHAQSKWAA